MGNNERVTYRLARIHSETVFALTRKHTWYLSAKTTEDAAKLEAYYERLIPVIEGKTACPICSIRYNLIRDLQSGKLDIPSFLSFGADYTKHITSPEKLLKLEEFKAFIRTAYDIDVVTYYEIYNLINENALHSYKTDESLLYHTVTPTVYFGVLTLHHPDYIKKGAIVTSEKAIELFFKTYHHLLDSQGDVLKYIEGKYVLTQKERVLNAIVHGEKLVAQIQQERNLPRWEALTYCVEFGVVTDLFTWACAEFRLRGSELIALRPRLRKFADDRETPQVLRLKEEITKAQDDYYHSGVRAYKKKKSRYGTRPGKRNGPTLKEQWHGSGF